MSEMLKEFADRSRALADLADGQMRERLLRLANDYDDRAGTPVRKLTPATLALRQSDRKTP